MKGQITGRRYLYATVFIDHFSDFTYVHLQETLTSADTLNAKHAFEAKCHTHEVPVMHYHCDNGQFADNAFNNSVSSSRQTISYCFVNAHFQNGRAEKKIAISGNQLERNYYTLSIAGRLQSIHTSGQTRCDTQMASTTCCQQHKMQHAHYNCFRTPRSTPISRTFIRFLPSSCA